MSDMPTRHNRFVPSRGCTRGVVLYTSGSPYRLSAPEERYGYKLLVRAIDENTTAEAEIFLEDLERALADLRHDVESEEDKMRRKARDDTIEHALALANVVSRETELATGTPLRLLDPVNRLVSLVRSLLTTQLETHPSLGGGPK